MAALVVGLGNPGPDYASTRHNVGQVVVGELARRGGVTLSAFKGRALAASIRIPGPRGVPGDAIVIATPTSYMNVSGGAVSTLAKYHSVEPTDVIVIHDELDLPFGVVRLKRGGGEGGHNGLKDVSKALGTRDYVRVRVGIGRPPGHMEPADFVLRPFGTAERKDLPWLIDTAADAVESLVADGLEAAQQKFHSQD